MLHFPSPESVHPFPLFLERNSPILQNNKVSPTTGSLLTQRISSLNGTCFWKGEKLQSLHQGRAGYPWARERLLSLEVKGSENQLGAQGLDLQEQESPVVSHFFSCLGQGAKAQAAHSKPQQPLDAMVFIPHGHRSTRTFKHPVTHHSQPGHPGEAWGHHCSLPATSAASGDLQILLWLREQVCLGLADRKMQIYCNSKRKIMC